MSADVFVHEINKLFATFDPEEIWQNPQGNRKQLIQVGVFTLLALAMERGQVNPTVEEQVAFRELVYAEYR